MRSPQTHSKMLTVQQRLVSNNLPISLGRAPQRSHLRCPVVSGSTIVSVLEKFMARSLETPPENA
jgi:hypothetical protein